MTVTGNLNTKRGASKAYLSVAKEPIDEKARLENGGM